MDQEENFSSASYDSIGEPAAPAALPVESAPAPDTPGSTDIPPASSAETPLNVPPPAQEAAVTGVNKAFLDEFDDIGKELGGEPETAPVIDKALLPEGSAPDESAAAISQSDEEKDAEPALETADDPSKEKEPVEEEVKPEDWDKLSKETEEYISKLPSNAERARARAAEKGSKMAISFLNPNSPAEQWVENLKAKSAMRFGEVESVILKQNAEADPVGFLGKIFEATADGDGNSETYQKLLDSLVETNTDYVVSALKAKGFELGAGGAETENLQSSQIEDLSDEELEGFEESEAFTALKDAYPEDADKISKLLEKTKTESAELNRLKSEEEKRSQEAENQTKEKVQTEAQKQTQATVESFNNVYQETVTAQVNRQLEKDFGLKVTDEERAENPQMAFLKEAKAKLILNGGLNGTGDFDNDLYQWGKSRPAFQAAAKAMVKFTQAGETENARAAAKELAPFAEMFMNERMKSPEIELIDAVIQAYTRDFALQNKVKKDVVPNSVQGGAVPKNGKTGLLQEIDEM